MLSRRRFLVRSAAAGVALATVDPVEVVRKLWPGYSAARDGGYVSVGFDVRDPRPVHFAEWVDDTLGELKRPWTEMGYTRSGLAYVDMRVTSVTLRAGELLQPGDLVRMDNDGCAVKALELEGVLGQVMASGMGAGGVVAVQTAGLINVNATLAKRDKPGVAIAPPVIVSLDLQSGVIGPAL